MTSAVAASRGMEATAPEGHEAHSESQPVFCFSVLAEADPGLMPRVLELFAKRSLVPLRWHSDRIGSEQSELAMDFQVGGLTPHLADYIARCLRQVPGVRTVLTSEKNI
ncbi:MAG: hypothetical protein ACQETX_09595 [Pseudomonadota bacterium]